MKPLQHNSPDLAALTLRVSLGVVLLAHSVYLKFFVFSLGGTAQYFSSLGLPAASAYLVFAIEAIGGIFLILGLKTHWVSIALLPVLLGATWAHASNGWLFSNVNGGWEYPLLLSILVVVQFLLGNGRFAIDNNAQTAH